MIDLYVFRRVMDATEAPELDLGGFFVFELSGPIRNSFGG
jgi:hypothetical protein